MNQSYDTTTPENGENPSLSANDLKLTALQEFLSLRDFVAPEGLATLRVSFPCPLAAGGLANYLKLTALRPLGFSRTSPYRSKLLTALHEKSPALCAELQIVCGERGSRTYAFKKYHKIANH